TSAGKSSSERLRYFEALIQQARVLVLQSRHEEAIKIAETVTDTGPADDAPLQAEAYVILGNSLQALSRPKEAVLAYLHVDLLYPKQGDFRAEALFRLVKAWKAVQQPDRSSEAESRLVQNYPNSAWRKKLAAGEASE
ncbi:MAG: tetratricopeptide repeat protein, partial [Planctomycetes bacterium]|nr:tetratricopeptide repeat protein [Planctomycetota bacterium]